MKKTILLTGFVGLASSFNVFSQEPSEPSAPFVVGLGGVYNSSAYQDIGARTQVIPVLFGSIGDFRFQGDRISYELVKYDNFTVSPVVSFGLGQGFSRSDIDSGSYLYDGLDEREQSFGAGIELGYDHKLFSSALRVITDITGNHSGYSVNWSLQKNYFVTPQFIVTPSVAATYDSDKINQYYFGVSEQEANQLRAEYDAKGGVNFDIGLTATWMPSNKWTVISGVNYVFYNSEVTNSPLVDSDGEAIVFFGAGYNF